MDFFRFENHKYGMIVLVIFVKKRNLVVLIPLRHDFSMNVHNVPLLVIDGALAFAPVD